jgi:uncharacterized protein YcbK (DUF882 family)
LNYSRRDFLKLGANATVASLLPIPALAETTTNITLQRTISFFNTHTDESIDICYFDKGVYCPDGLNRINYILRDHRTKEVQPIDLGLVETLYAVKAKIRSKTPIHIISGYRSPATNAMLRKTTHGVAQTSYHTKGKAIDIRIPGCSSRRLRDVCISMQSGGVGYYGDSNFVHLDTGPIRAW